MSVPARAFMRRVTFIRREGVIGTVTMGDSDSSQTNDGITDQIEYEDEQVTIEGEGESDIRVHVDEAVAAVQKRLRDGTLALSGGALILYRAVRTARRNRGRAAIRAVIGMVLIALGQRQRRSVDDDRHGDKATANPVNEGRQPEIDADEMVEDEPKTKDK